MKTRAKLYVDDAIDRCVKSLKQFAPSVKKCEERMFEITIRKRKYTVAVNVELSDSWNAVSD